MELRKMELDIGERPTETMACFREPARRKTDWRVGIIWYFCVMSCVGFWALVLLLALGEIG